MSIFYCRKAASRRLAVSLLILLLTVGVVGVGTWGLTDSIRNTNHQVDTAWGIVATAKSTVSAAALAVLPCLMWDTPVWSNHVKHMAVLQVTNVSDIATTIFSLLDQLGNTLVTTSKILTGLSTFLRLHGVFRNSCLAM